MRESRRVTIEPPGSSQLSLMGHREIFEAVKSKDRHQARAAMRQHLLMVRRVLGNAGFSQDDKPVALLS
ncbi:MAG TPA: FCD domain-containing protein [Chloroflexi bacterium]|nr:FCD domain-containing protein [Chloroflexota bacterium]